jgi:hypothetical protein
MDPFDWIREHDIVPDLNINESFDGVKVLVSRGLRIRDYEYGHQLKLFPTPTSIGTVVKFFRKKGLPTNFWYFRVTLKIIKPQVNVPKNVYNKLSKETIDDLTVVQFLWRGSIPVFQMPISDLKSFYQNQQIRLNLYPNQFV